MELRDLVIGYLKGSNKSLSHVDIFYALLIENHISRADMTFSKIKEIKKICERLAKEGVFIENEGKFTYNNEYKEEIIVEPAKIKTELKEIELEKNDRVNQLLNMNHELFSTLLITYLLLLLAETIREGTVSAFMDMNYLLIIVIVTGVISVLTQKEEEKPEKVKLTGKDYIYIVILGVIGAAIVWYKIQDIGKLSYLISIIAGVLIILLSTLLFDEEETMVDIVEIIRIIAGSVFVLFLPGFAWSFVFFKKDEIDWIERIALSFGLSIALVPTAVFWLNYFLGVKINLLNVSLVILALTGTAAGIYALKGKYTLKELNYKITHDIPKNHIIVLGSTLLIFIIFLFVIFSSMPQPQSSELPPPSAPIVNVTDTPRVDISQVSPGINGTEPPRVDISQVTPGINGTETPLASSESIGQTPTPLITPVREPQKYSIKITVSHGFQPDVITINESDIIVWNNEEIQRPRVVLISKDKLFENKIMQLADKYSFQFNSSGNYSFVLAEHNTLNEYPNAAFNVVVK